VESEKSKTNWKLIIFKKGKSTLIHDVNFLWLKGLGRMGNKEVFEAEAN